MTSIIPVDEIRDLVYLINLLYKLDLSDIRFTRDDKIMLASPSLHANNLFRTLVDEKYASHI